MDWIIENALDVIIYSLAFMEAGAICLSEMYLITYMRAQYMINVDHYHSVIRAFHDFPLIIMLVIGVCEQTRQTIIVTIMMIFGGCWLLLSLEGAVVFGIKKRTINNLKAWNVSIKFGLFFVLDSFLAWFLFV
jgi:hypothetical protein